MEILIFKCGNGHNVYIDEKDYKRTVIVIGKLIDKGIKFKCPKCELFLEYYDPLG